MGFDWLEKLLGLGHAVRLAFSSKTEISLIENCIREVKEKRKRALKRSRERAAFTKKHGKAISNWEGDDRYADDSFYKKKLTECYKENRPVKRAIGLP